ncbi:MAG: hypothetical protein ACOYXN_08415 [Acidobacteriota bacterium]
MRPEDERLIFEHDLATPLTNLRGAQYLLKLYVKDPAEPVAEALQILESNTRTLERMLGWYWRLRELPESPEEGEPWGLSGLPADLSRRIAQESLPILPPGGATGDARLVVPRSALETGLLGAAITLASAAGRPPEWFFEPGEGLCHAVYTLDGDEELLDAGRILRKVYWPSARPVKAWLDCGLPYLSAVLKPFGGGLELIHREGLWRLEAAIPLSP